MLNRVILIGNLGAEPDVRMTPKGMCVATIRLATSRKWRERQTGEAKQETEWHRVIFFNRLAEIVSDYVRKGQQIYIEGRIQTRKWQSQDGSDHYTTEIVAEELHILGNTKKEKNRTDDENYGQSYYENGFNDSASDDNNESIFDDIPF